MVYKLIFRVEENLIQFKILNSFLNLELIELSDSSLNRIEFYDLNNSNNLLVS